jgi:hypothetical protein
MIRALWGPGWPRLPRLDKYCRNGGHGLRRPAAMGRESHPIRTLLIAENRTLKPKIEGCGNGAPLGA